MGDEDNKDLEKEFQTAFNEAEPLIEAELKKARAALRAACEIAEKYGVPFSSGISPLSQGYIPDSYEEKFSELDQSVVSEITEVYDRHGDGLYPGWQHSAVC